MMRCGTTAASFRRHQAIAFALATQFMPNTNLGLRRPPVTDTYRYEKAKTGVRAIVVSQEIWDEKVAA